MRMKERSTALLYPKFFSDAPYVTRGVGSFLYDESGRDYIDGCAGAMIASIGHGREEIARAAADQMRTLAFAYRSQWRNEPAEQLADTVVSLAGDKSHVFFLNSGSEANEAAYRIALQYHRLRGNHEKQRVISCAPSNHGNTLASLSIGYDVRRGEIGKLALEECARKVEQPCSFRYPDRDALETSGMYYAQQFENAIIELGPETTAAVYIEPVSGALGGAIVSPPGYLPRLRQICDKYDVLLVADEVVTGFGRLGKWFGMQAFGTSADITVIGKGISGGYAPLSGVLMSEAVSSTVAEARSIAIGHTNSANPMCAAVGSAVIGFMQEHGVVESVPAKGERLAKGLWDLAKHHTSIGDVRGMGLLRAVEIVQDRETRTPYSSDGKSTTALVHAAREAGLMVFPCRGLGSTSGDNANALGGDAVLFAPPLTISEDEIDMVLDRFDTAMVRFGKLAFAA